MLYALLLVMTKNLGGWQCMERVSLIYYHDYNILADAKGQRGNIDLYPPTDKNGWMRSICFTILVVLPSNIKVTYRLYA
ncbi:MAG: hypothetical protein KJ914_13715 [Gammaproteobacteria bacterium]|nr:hypothetical protein [Gammaproteobacteria bacterium]MBU1723822.1 hypothetical protein [Gammaproteobacteria bacterium]MBU2007015.1 hypothetical protein [Gammaproteobacteria bacterium]